MRVLFFSMHGSSAIDLALLCKSAKVEFWMGHPESTQIRTKTQPQEVPDMEAMGVQFAAAQKASEMMSRRDTLVILATPQQIEQYKAGGWVAPFAVRHGLNSFDKFLRLGTKNFITASLKSMAKMPGCNCFLTRKFIPWDIFPRPNLSHEGRSGFSSFIHDYRKKWGMAYAKFQAVNDMLPEPATNYGEGEPCGIVNDLGKMAESVATLHIKGGNAVCNAVVRSMSTGTPVVMDRETYEDCHFDCVDGILVGEDLREVATMALRLRNDKDHLEDQCYATYSAARRQFSPDEALADGFRQFLGSLA